MLLKTTEGMIRTSLGKLRLPNASPFGRRSSPQSIVLHFARFVTRSLDGLIGQDHIQFYNKQ